MKSLVLIRHAHRSTDQGRERDNGLTEKGKKQRKALAKYFFKNHGKKSLSLLSSPSKRCQETLALIARKSKVRIEVGPALGEQTSKEGHSTFKKRVSETISELLKRESEITLICSHGDWIPVATLVLTGIAIDISKGGWIEFEVGGAEVQLRNVIQKMD